MDVVKLYLFGTPRIEFHDRAVNIPRPKSVALAAYLALLRQPQSRAPLTALFLAELDLLHASASWI